MLMRILPLALATLSMASASADEAEIKKAMEAKLGAKVESVTKSGFLGLYEVYSEGNILYTDEKMTAFLAGGQLIDLQVYGPKIQQMQQVRATALAEVEKKAGVGFLAKAAAESGAKKTESGAIVTTIKEGKGATPKATDTVKVHYHGTLIDGTVFDSSVKRGEPATFPLNQVIKCWTEAVQLINVGGKSKLVQKLKAGA